MKTPLTYYKTYKKKYQLEANRLHKKTIGLSTLRLLVFLITCFCVYYFFYQWKIVIPITITGIIIFIYLLSKHTNTKRKRNFNKALVQINDDEITITSGNFHNRQEGLEFQNANHFYSLDIDLFGRGSLFQYINRTTTNEGAYKLAEALKANDINDITLRQEAIKELASKIQWRQYYSATSSLINIKTPTKQITQWLHNYNSFFPKAISWVPILFSLASITLCFLTISGFITTQSLIAYWLLLGLGITGTYLKRVNILATNTDKARDTFRQYADLLKLIENESFSSKLLLQKQKQIQSGKKKASNAFKAFSKTLDALDNRNNIIGAILGNGYFLTDLKNSYNIEQWIKEYQNKVSDWFEVISFFEAYNTLGNYTYNHPDFVFPKIVDHGIILKTENLGHPLLNKDKRVASNLTINNEQFFIITGANMAGKSTFLRTVSLHIVMANTGLPVCAKSSSYSPIKLITSMRTSDSLANDSSYFFSELTRLKFIVDTIQKEPYFIILDEILKGTNSTDKAIGSKQFVEKLVASNTSGIIATHDLSLCEIKEELENVKNYYFDAEIINDELYFDYKLKQGICQNMNASFLLKKMNIV